MTTIALLYSSKPMYSHSEATSRAYYSKVAYCSDKESLEDWSCKYCASGPNKLESVIVLNDRSTEMQTIVGYDAAEGAVALVFRGSSNLKNWELNAELTLVKWIHTDECPKVATSIRAFSAYGQACAPTLSMRSSRYLQSITERGMFSSQGIL